MERYGSHYQPLVGRVRLAKMLRQCDALDEDQRLWLVYGDDFRCFVEDMATSLERRRQAFDNLVGSARSGAVRKPDRTVRAKARVDRHHLWATRPHVCEVCGLDLVPSIARVHHVHQVQDGGSSDDDNMLLLCLNCNARQHVRP